MKVKRSKINQSLEKTIQLVETMARGQGSMRLQDIANQCGMPPSTALRMLNTLAADRPAAAGPAIPA